MKAGNRLIFRILSALMLIIPAVVNGQSQVMYYMNIPQNHLLNPALRPSNSLYIGLPGVTGIDISIRNNFLDYSDIIAQGINDSLVKWQDFDTDAFLSGLKEKNSIEQEVMYQLFGLGFNAGKNYIFFDIIDHLETNLVFPRDMFELALRDPSYFAGKNLDLSSFNLGVKYYREAGIGFSRNFTNRFRAGVKAKMLFGITSVSMDNRALKVMVNPDLSRTVQADLSMNISGPVMIGEDRTIDNLEMRDFMNTADSAFSFFAGMGNIGFGLDLGAVYEITNRISISASLTDLGYIRWRKDIMYLDTDQEIELAPMNLADVVDGEYSFDDYASALGDTVINSVEISRRKDPFTTFVPFGLNLGGSFNLNKSISLGVLSSSRFIGDQVKQSLTFSGNLNLRNALTLSLAYTASNHRYDNLGAGLAFRAGFFQFYLVTDRIPVRWERIRSEDLNLVLPANWNNINLRLGMNLSFGNSIKKKNDKPMMVVE